jgi:hypothetical protein
LKNFNPLPKILKDEMIKLGFSVWNLGFGSETALGSPLYTLHPLIFSFEVLSEKRRAVSG